MHRIPHLFLALGIVGLVALTVALAAGAQAPARAGQSPTIAAGNTLYVLPGQSIQAAIDAASEGDEIWVAKGVYTENLSIDKGIALYGGWNISFTLQTPGDSIVNGNNVGRVISITCATSDTMVTIDGFTIQNGNASGLGLFTVPEPPVSDPVPERAETAPATQSPDPRSPSERAAELRVRLADLAARGLYPGGAAAYQTMLARLERLTVRAEEARARANAASVPSPAQSKQGSGTGGGIYSENASLQLLNCTIGGNVASQDILGVGGGVFVADAPPSGVRIANNYVGENVGCMYGDGWGGGLYVVNAPGAIIGNNVVEANVASNDGNGYGGGLYVYESPGVVIQDNQFLQNLGSDAGYGSEGIGGGLGVDSSPDAVVSNNLVEGNTASGAWNALRGIGGGLFLSSSNGAVVRDNQIRENLAILYGQQGRGGGVQFVWSNYALVADNEVTGNLAALFSGDAQGGGIKAAAVYSTTLSGNEIRENAACVYGDFEGGLGDFGGGVYGTEYEHSWLSDNAITANATCHYCGRAGGFGGGAFIGSSEDAVAAGNTIADNAGALLEGVGVGGGLHLRDTTGSQVLRNRILGNRGGVADDSGGGGLVLDCLEGTTAQANVDGNLILDNQASGDPTATSVDGGCSVAEMLGGFSFTNNVVAGNQAAYVGGVSLWSLPQGGTVVNNTIADNGDIGLLVTGSTLTFDNNIVVSHTVGITVAAGATATVRYTLWSGNGTDVGGGGTISHTHPVTGSPAFVNPAAHDYHLTVGSAARDTGDPAGVPPAPPVDHDGVARPQGPAVDIGAYEWRGHWQYLPLVFKQYQPIIGWAVGDSIGGYGTILHTTDGGASWVRQGSPADVPNTDLEEVSAVDAQHAWVVGSQAILRTRDGGQTWETQPLPTGVPTDTELFGVKAIDGNTAWAVGKPDVLLGTADGQTWNVMPRGADLHLALPVHYSGVDAADATHVWAVGAFGPGDRGEPVIAFYDGVQWHRQGTGVIPNGNSAALIGVSVLDQDTVWAVGGASFTPFPMAKTTDGGASWQQVGQPPIPGLDTNRVVAVTADVGWASGDDGNVVYTTDAGATWYHVNVPSAFLFGITAMDDQTAWVVGPGVHGTPPGIIARTRDAHHWEVQSDPAWPNMNGISFVGARR